MPAVSVALFSCVRNRKLDAGMIADRRGRGGKDSVEGWRKIFYYFFVFILQKCVLFARFVCVFVMCDSVKKIALCKFALRGV